MDTDKKPPSVVKAYRNHAFLDSRDGRPLRILAEYLEPEARFDRLRVRDTIVFFGSARILHSGKTRARLRQVYPKAEQLSRRQRSLEKPVKLVDRDWPRENLPGVKGRPVLPLVLAAVKRENCRQPRARRHHRAVCIASSLAKMELQIVMGTNC